MLIANIHEAKTNLSSLIASVLSGKDVVIAKAGVPVVKLIQFIPDNVKRIPGLFKGDVWMSDKFDEESNEISKMFS
ncbi:MAG: prevent-host-death family protein [uncultured bacterium]|nr:MAG: prevent-host-death family protein [uncultured bacterium]